MIKKITLAVLYLGIALLIYSYGNDILAWFREPSNVVIVVIAATVMAFFPVIPYPIVGGVIGAAYGSVWGGLVTWAGSAAASILMFAFVRYGYQDWGIKLLRKYKITDRATTLFERNAFLTILFARSIPVMPSVLVNVYAAVSRVSFVSYTVSSLIGKIPAMLLFAIVGNSLITNPKNVVITIVVYGVFVGVTLYIYHLWGKSKTELGGHS
jgi:uncharacterized membrane protein YdjX (TVP38/TMEM64 family)